MAHALFCRPRPSLFGLVNGTPHNERRPAAHFFPILHGINTPMAPSPHFLLPGNPAVDVSYSIIDILHLLGIGCCADKAGSGGLITNKLNCGWPGESKHHARPKGNLRAPAIGLS